MCSSTGLLNILILIWKFHLLYITFTKTLSKHDDRLTVFCKLFILHRKVSSGYNVTRDTNRNAHLKVDEPISAIPKELR